MEAIKQRSISLEEHGFDWHQRPWEEGSLTVYSIRQEMPCHGDEDSGRVQGGKLVVNCMRVFRESILCAQECGIKGPGILLPTSGSDIRQQRTLHRILLSGKHNL